jgi:cell division protein FtsB
VALVAVLVAATLFYLWQKVALADVLRRIDRAETRLGELAEARAKLTAEIVFRKKPEAIEQAAFSRLHMTYPGGRLAGADAKNHRGAID